MLLLGEGRVQEGGGVSLPVSAEEGGLVLSCAHHPFLSHEMPSDPNDPLSNQKLKERYYGTEDPVADKLLKQAADMPQLTPPQDKTVTSLYVGGVEDDIAEKDLRHVIMIQVHSTGLLAYFCLNINFLGRISTSLGRFRGCTWHRSRSVHL